MVEKVEKVAKTSKAKAKEDECCCLEKVRAKKVLFWRFSLVSFIFLVYSYLSIIMGFESIQEATESSLKCDFRTFSYITTLIFGVWKVLLVQFGLVPALVFTWMEHDLTGKKR